MLHNKNLCDWMDTSMHIPSMSPCIIYLRLHDGITDVMYIATPPPTLAWRYCLYLGSKFSKSRSSLEICGESQVSEKNVIFWSSTSSRSSLDNMLCLFKFNVFKLRGKTVDMFDDNSESDCGPGFGFLSSESIRIKNSTKRLLHINDIICDVRVVC